MGFELFFIVFAIALNHSSPIISGDSINTRHPFNVARFNFLYSSDRFDALVCRPFIQLPPLISIATFESREAKSKRKRRGGDKRIIEVKVNTWIIFFPKFGKRQFPFWEFRSISIVVDYFWIGFSFFCWKHFSFFSPLHSTPSPRGCAP